MSLPNNPIVNAGLLYVNGLQIANTTYLTAVSTLFLTQGAARDSTNISDIILSDTLTLDIKKSGANGLDIGSGAINTCYAVYVIGDSTDNNSTAGLFSLATSAIPYLPSGYDMYRRVGWIFTDPNVNINHFAQAGNNENRTYYYFGPLNVLTNGSATTYTPVNLSAFVPPISGQGITNVNEVLLNVNYTPSSASNRVEFNDFEFAGIIPLGIVQFGTGVAGQQFGSIRVPSQAQQIFYRAQAGDSVTLNVTGYTDYLS